MSPGEWTYRNGRWQRGTYRVTKSDGGLRAQMKMGRRFVTIGTSDVPSVPAFLDKINQFIHLTETVYA